MPSLSEQHSQANALINCYEAVYESVRDGMIIVDAKGNVQRTNKALHALLCFPQLTGEKQVAELSNRPEIQDVLNRICGRKDSFETEVQVGGGGRVLHLWGTPLYDPSDAFIGTLIVVKDITKLRSLEKVRRDFVANVSHELKTPITSIKGFVETLLDGAKDEPEARERFLNIVLAHADRMTALIEDLLILARLESEQVDDLLIIEDEKLSEIIQSVELLCSAKAEAKGIHVETKCPAFLSVRVDRSMLEQAIFNLVENAIKYSDTNKRVYVEAGLEAGNVVIRVADEGVGISVEHLPRLFERFYRVDKARSRQMGGTGLGLAIVKHVAAVHKGSIGVQSKVGSGSVFSIYLPRSSSRGN